MEKISLFRKGWYKFILNNLGRIVRRDKPSQQYLLSFVLKKETADFYEEVYIRGYHHIDKSIDLAKKYISNISGNDIILDIGGSNGATAIRFATAFPANNVYVFEPLIQHHRELEINCSSFKNVIVVPKAAGSENKKQKLMVGKSTGVSSLLKFTPDSQSELFNANLETTGEQETETIKLDDFPLDFNRILILKIDVQGFEIEVMKGALQRLKKTAIVVLEVNNHDYYEGAPKYHEVDNFMRSIHFQLFDLLPSTRDHDQLKEWDVIYVNRLFFKETD